MRDLPLILALAVALLVAHVSQADRADRDRPPGSVAMLGLTDAQEDQLLAERGSHYRYLTVRNVRPRTRRRLGELAAANARTRILVYVNAGFMVHDRRDPAACSYWPYNGDGVDYCRARRRHEDWFLHRPARRPGEPAAKRRLRSEGYRSGWAADIASASYQREWLRNVLWVLRHAEGRRSDVRVDGVFVDDLNLEPGHGMDGRVAELTDDQYREAAIDFGSRIGRRIERAGFLAVANVGLDVHDPVQRAAMVDLAGELSAINREYFVRYGAGDPVFTTPAANNGNDWLTELELFEAVQAQDAGYVGIVYGHAPRGGREREAARYGRASFLLGWDGRSQSALAFRTLDGSSPRGHGAWQMEIGDPAEARRRVGARHAYVRRYTRGIVAVNADPAHAQLLELGGLYRVGAACVPAVLLPAATGRVLERC